MALARQSLTLWAIGGACVGGVVSVVFHTVRDSHVAAPAVRGIVSPVYVTASGKKYHRAGCRSLRTSSVAIELRDAMMSYGPCRICQPPTR